MIFCAILDNEVKKLANIGNICEFSYFDSLLKWLSPLDRCVFGQKDSWIKLQERIDVVSLDNFG